MSLLPKIYAKESNDYVVVYDKTGKYSGSNQGGFGSPNVDISNVMEAYVEVYTPQNDIPVIISVYSGFPTLDKDLGYELPISLFSMTEVESGVWKIGYRLKGKDSKGVSFEKYNECKFIFTKSAECCVDKIVASTVNIPLIMKDERRKASDELAMTLRRALWAKERDMYDAAQTHLKFITLQCNCCC